MKLTYWCARQDQDHECYNIRTRTKKECKAEMEKNPNITWEGPFKVTVEYKDAFDLASRCLGEGRVYEYPSEEKKKKREVHKCPVCNKKSYGICLQCTERGYWMDPIGTIHAEGDDPTEAYK